MVGGQRIIVEAMEMVVETTGVLAPTMEALVMVEVARTVDLQEVLEGLMSRQTGEAY